MAALMSSVWAQNNIAYANNNIVDKSATDIIEKQYIVSADCYIQVYSRTQKTLGEPFIRLSINCNVVFEGYGSTGNYRYLWSPIFPVKKGDVVQYTLTTDTADGDKEVRTYFDNM